MCPQTVWSWHLRLVQPHNMQGYKHYSKTLVIKLENTYLNTLGILIQEWRDAKTREKEPGGQSNNNGRKKGSAGKMLWKAFQFAYRVYTFAGGLDDRADRLTKELADEIEKEPNP